MTLGIKPRWKFTCFLVGHIWKYHKNAWYRECACGTAQTLENGLWLTMDWSMPYPYQ